MDEMGIAIELKNPRQFPMLSKPTVFNEKKLSKLYSKIQNDENALAPCYNSVFSTKTCLVRLPAFQTPLALICVLALGSAWMVSFVHLEALK